LTQTPVATEIESPSLHFTRSGHPIWKPRYIWASAGIALLLGWDLN
jgi:hypothetical protein